MLLLGLSGLVVGILNSFDQFAVPALAPLAWNLAIIATLIVLVPQFEGDDRIYAYAIGVLIGTLVQLLLPLPWLRRTGFRIARDFNWRDERVMRVLKLMFPVTIGLGLINFNLSVDSIFATLISDEAPAAIDKAFRIYMLPQGVFAVALATVLFPTFSRLATRGDTDGLRAVQGSGVRQMLLLLVPCAALMMVLSEPITRIIYQRGEFDAAQTDLVSEALFFFALSLPFAGINLILIRTFFSLQSPWTPTFIALGNLGRERRPRRAAVRADGHRRHPAGDRDRLADHDRRAGARAARAARRPRPGPHARRRACGCCVAGRAAGGGHVRRAARRSRASATAWSTRSCVVGAASAAGLAVYAALVLAMRVDEAHQIRGARPRASSPRLRA